MKRTNKSIVVVLSFVMLLVGLHILPNEAQATTLLTNPDMLKVKWQMTSTPLAEGAEEISKYQANAGDYLVRLVSSVDSLEYSKVGFILTNLETNASKDSGTVFDANNESHYNKTVYKRIDSTLTEKYEFGPKVVDTSSEYFITAKTYITPGVEYKVQAYVVTTSGARVCGEERYINTNDTKDITTVVSFAYPNTYSKDDEISGITINNDTTARYKATVLYANSNIVKISIPVEDSELPAVTVFNIPEYGNVEYRNLYSTSSEGDTTWYTVYDAKYSECEDESQKREFVIATKADLLGLASAVDTIGLTEGDTFYLAADFDLTGVTWTPVGSTNAFSGTFDGNDHTITGLTVSGTGNIGMFAQTTNGSTVQDLNIASASITSTAANVGTIAGQGGGNFINIIVDNKSTVNSTVKAKNVAYVGALVGSVSEGKTVTITNCHTQGTVTALGTSVGGFVGEALKNTEVTITGSTSAGSISSTGSTTQEAKNGGFIGVTNLFATVTISESRFTGEVISTTNNNKAMGGLIGYVYGSNQVTINKCLIDGTLKGHSIVGGLIAKIDNPAAGAENIKVTITDCHISGDIMTLSTYATVPELGGLVGGIKGASEERQVTVQGNRCLMTAKVDAAAASQGESSILVGYVQSYGTFECTGEVYYVNDANYHDVVTKDGKYALSVNGTNSIVTYDNAYGVLTTDFPTNAETVVNALLTAKENGNNIWVTTGGFPTLSIFATSN